MKLNSTSAAMLTFILVMVGSGLISGLKGYTMGYEALKEISQPKINPQKQSQQPLKDQKMIVSETKILQQVNAKMNRTQDKAVPLNDNQSSSDNKQQ